MGNETLAVQPFPLTSQALPSSPGSPRLQNEKTNGPADRQQHEIPPSKRVVEHHPNAHRKYQNTQKKHIMGNHMGVLERRQVLTTTKKQTQLGDEPHLRDSKG